MKQYTVDAFTEHVFSGNPAAVCVMEGWLPENTMRAIAKENNLSETAFIVKEEGGYHLRWFTPNSEVDLCGHATLASAFVIMNFYEKDAAEITFDTLSGKLFIRRRQDIYELDLPTYELKATPVTDAMSDAIGCRPVEAFLGRDLLCVLPTENDVRDCQPNQAMVQALDGLILHITASGSNGTDCVSRSFAPKLAIAEDPVCGSGHCHIVPYWSKKLGKNDLVAYQASDRGGTLYCRQQGKRTILSGKAALYAASDIHIS